MPGGGGSQASPVSKRLIWGFRCPAHGDGTRQLDYFFAHADTATRATGWTDLTHVVTALALSDHASIQIDLD